MVGALLHFNLLQEFELAHLTGFVALGGVDGQYFRSEVSANLIATYRNRR